MRTAFLFSLDGCITTTEVLPCIASEIGASDAMASLTRATNAGHIPFDTSFRLRCLILAHIPLERVHRIVSSIPLDRFILSFIRSRRDACFLVSGNPDVWVKPIADRCGCSVIASTGSYESGHLEILRTLDRRDSVSSVRAMGFERIVAIGDSVEDLTMFSASDVCIAYGGLHAPAPMAITTCHYVIQEGHALCKMLQAL